MGRPPSISRNLERALRLAAQAHDGQARKGAGTPYIQHPMAVALILERAGFGEPVVIAGLLHDVVEDTDLTLNRVASEFGPEIAALVDAASEIKVDREGSKRPWADRKRDHVASIRSATDEAKGLVLADKLHNLLSIQVDLSQGCPIRDSFHAPRPTVLDYYRAMINACRSDDPRVATLAEQAVQELASLVNMGVAIRGILEPKG